MYLVFKYISVMYLVFSAQLWLFYICRIRPGKQNTRIISSHYLHINIKTILSCSINLVNDKNISLIASTKQYVDV